MNVEQAMKRLGSNVKKRRLKRGLTQEQMMDFGFNYRYFQKIEGGQVNATLELLVRLARALKCDLEDLLK